MHEHERIGKFLPLMKSLYASARNTLGFKPHVKIVILSDEQNMNNPLGKTAHYSPADHKIGLYTQGRHIKDVLRSFAHELVHHSQNCRGEFDGGAPTVKGYAQNDDHLREMEREAYEQGNLIFRDWEDNLKEKGARPLFTSTVKYVPSPTSDVVGGGMLEEKKMKKKVNESHLRNIIRGVIQEMFNEDLNEDANLPGLDNAEANEAAEEEAEKAGGQVGAVYKGVSEGKKLPSAHAGTQKGDFRKTGPADVPAYEDDKEAVTEDSGEKEAWHDWKNEHADDDHIEQIKHHLRALEDDRDYEEHEAKYDHDKYEDEGYDRHDESIEGEKEVNESYFPNTQDIRSKARKQTYEGLISRWGYVKKEK